MTKQKTMLNCHNVTEPLKKQFSQVELIEIAKDWMKNESGYSTLTNANEYRQNLGLLLEFIFDLFEDKNHE